MRKALVAALVVAFVLSIAATASAAVLTPASFPDVQGQACADAVAKLEALGIGKGIDGQWMPLAPVTRAQFAAFAVRLLGLEGVVKYMVGPTKFPDVPATHWASGYVNVAVAKKLLAGHPDGTFHPDENITFPQAATVLGRVLGYVNLPGEWPSNYMVVASENGLFEGVEFGGDFVTRGDMAIMLWNALKAQVVQYKYYSDLGIWDYEKQWDDPNKTNPTLLLEKGLGAKQVEGVVTRNADIDAALEAAEVKIGADSYTMPGAVNTAAILGAEVSVLAKGTTVLFAEDVTASGDVVKGTLDADVTGTTLSIKDGDDYTLADSATVVVNKKVTDKVYLTNGTDVTAFKGDDGNIRFVVGFRYDVKEGLVDTDGVDTTNKTLKVAGVTYTVLSNATITKNGAAAALGDLKDGDVVYIALAPPAGDNKALVIAAFDRSVSGIVTALRVGSDGKTYLKLGDTEYKVSASATGTLDGLDLDKDSPEDGLQWDELDDLFGFNVTAKLNKDNELRVLTGTTAGIIGLWGEFDNTKPAVKIDVKGTKTEYPAASTTIAKPATNDIDYSTPVIAKTNAAGKVTSVEELTAVATNVQVQAVSTANNKITVGGNVYAVSADAVFKTPAGAYVGLAGVRKGDTVTLYYQGAGKPVLFGFLNPGAAVAKSNVYGKYTGYSVDETGAVTMYLDVKGTTTGYPLVGSPYGTIGAFVYAVVRTDGKVDTVDALSIATGLDSVKIVAINDDGTFTLENGTVIDPSAASVYDENKAPIAVGALKVGDLIDVYKGVNTPAGDDTGKVVVIQRDNP
ncbi:MAG: S-layer homology domain-containing protein [Bacillota bacterium]